MPLAVNPKNNQEVFSYALRKIREQGKPAMDKNGVCVYRGDGDTRCVAGWLISDDEYDKEMEGNMVSTESLNPSREYFLDAGFDLNLIIAMQEVHDNNAENGPFEMTEDDHRQLAEVLNIMQGKIVISGYPSALYDKELYSNWNRREVAIANHSAQNSKKSRKLECIWLNW